MAKKKELKLKQSSDSDDINRIESNVPSDIRGNDVALSGDVMPISQQSVAKEAALEEVSFKISTPKDSEHTFNFKSDEDIEYENYIQNLNDRVDEAINEMNAALQGHDLDELDNNDELKSFIDVLENHKQRFKSKEDIIVFWQDYEAFIKKNADPDAPKTYLDLDRLFYLRTLIDYIRDNHIFEDAIESLEEKLHIICEENPDASFISRFMSYLKILLPIAQFYMVFLIMMQFINENRPIADDTMFEDNNAPFKFITDRKLDLVFNELQKLPAVKLEALIQNTNCSHDVKTVLYNSVKNGDFNTFSNTIKTYENDVRILLVNAYDNHFARMIIKRNEYLFNICRSGPENPIEIMNRAIEKILLQNPYVDNGNDESIPDYILTDVQEADIKEQQLWLLDTLLIELDDCYKYAYPSEKKIFNRVRSLVDFNKYPELKEAYEDYKARQNAPSVTVEVATPIISEESKGKSGENDNNGVYHLPIIIKNINVDKLIRLLTEEDELNNNHVYITVLESKDDVDVATCMKHFLEGGSTTPRSFRLKWNGNSKVSLVFLIRLLVNTNEEANEVNVIDKNSKSGGCSKKFVSRWSGSGDLWAPVRNVFEGCTKSMQNTKLGDEGSPARKLNLEQLETISKMYFACR